MGAETVTIGFCHLLAHACLIGIRLQKIFKSTNTFFRDKTEGAVLNKKIA
jgi:hypothetical protein